MANLKFYPYHATTNGDLVDGDIDASPAAATGFPANNLLDRSRWTQFKSDAAATVHNFDFDLNSTTRTVDYVILAGHDILTQMSGATITVKHDNNSGFTSPTTIVNSVSITAEPHQLFTFTAPATTERYWKIMIQESSATNPPSIGSIYLGEKISASYFQEFGDKIGQLFLNKLEGSPSGEIRSNLTSLPKNSWGLPYQYMSETFKNNLRTVLLRTLGSHYPLFIQDDESNLFFVRLMISNYKPLNLSHQSYQFNLIVVQEDFVNFNDGSGIGVR